MTTTDTRPAALLDALADVEAARDLLRRAQDRVRRFHPSPITPLASSLLGQACAAATGVLCALEPGRRDPEAG